MVPVRLTPRRVLWLAGVCLLLLPSFACAAGQDAGDRRDVAGVYHAACADAVRSLSAQPLHRTVDDNNDDQSDDLIGDTWLAPCDMPAGVVVAARLGGLPGARQLQSSPIIRSFTAFDPFVPRPPPALSLL